MKDISLKLSAQPSAEGFDILAISAGEAKGHGIRFSADVLMSALPLYADLPVFIDHAELYGAQSVRNLAGTIHNPTWDEGQKGIKLQLRPSGPAAEVLTAVRDAALSEPAVMRAVGFSSVLRVQLDKQGNVTKIVSVRSVDAVIEPARGGKFLSALVKGVKNMSEEALEGAISDQERTALALSGAAEKMAALEAKSEQSNEVLKQMCANLLTTSLSVSRLPAASQAAIRKQFEGRVFEPAALETAITDKREELAEVLSGQVVKGPARITGMYSGAEQFELAVDDLLGVERDPAKANVKVARLSGIREAYILATGDRDFLGGYFQDFALGTTATFPVIVKNALNKRLADAWKKYGAAGYDWWSKIVTVEHFTTLQQIDWLILGTIGSLPSIAEQAEYTELPIGDNGETSDWTKYGGYVGLTLEAILRDDVRAFKRLPDEVAMGGMRNISEQVAAIFTVNAGAGPTLSDTGALFNATAVTTAGGHANLLTTALGTDLVAWRAAEAAMYEKPMHIRNAVGYYGTGKPQAVKPKYCLVPIELEGAATDLFKKTWNAAGENMGYGYVEPITVPEWTDATDWAAVADPNILPGIMLGEIFGLQPQIYVAGNESDPAMFANDESRIKVRQFLTVGIGNWRALHKNNVA